MLTLREKSVVELEVARIASLAGISKPTIEFFSNGTVAGKAYYGKHLVSFNEIIFRDNWNSILETIVHEIAHLTARTRYGTSIKPHGSEWRRVVYELGGVPSTTHNLDTSSTNTRKYFKFEYVCGCQTHELTSIRHNKILRGIRNYSCNSCKKELQYVKDLGKQ